MNMVLSHCCKPMRSAPCRHTDTRDLRTYVYDAPCSEYLHFPTSMKAQLANDRPQFNRYKGGPKYSLDSRTIEITSLIHYSRSITIIVNCHILDWLSMATIQKWHLSDIPAWQERGLSREHGLNGDWYGSGPIGCKRSYEDLVSYSSLQIATIRYYR